MHKNPYSAVYLTDGLGEKSQSRYKERRQRLMTSIPHLTVIPGQQMALGENNSWANIRMPICQNPEFLYLTGINQLNCILLLDPHSSESNEILFLPKKDLKMEFWDGMKLGVGDAESVEFARALTGIEDIRNLDSFGSVLIERFKAQPEKFIGLYYHEDENKKPKKDSYYAFKVRMTHLVRRHNLPAEVLVNISDLILNQRVILDEQDQKNLYEANRISADAFKETLASLKTLKNEAQFAGLLTGNMRMRSSFGESFMPIIAAGENAAILHYVKNDDVFEPEDLLLVDYGCKWYAMTADITRTIPISGEFNPLQRLIYEIVLDTQREVESRVRPGVTVSELNESCWDTMESLLEERFLRFGGKVTRYYEKKPHNVSHLIGHQVHDGDPYRLYRTSPLQPGQVISNEPGIYGQFEITLNGKLYKQHMGIRIEDDLLVTESCSENLSRDCPKTVDEIEAIIK